MCVCVCVCVIVLASSGHVSFTLTDSLASDMSLKMCLVDPLEKAQERLAAAYIFRKEYQMRTPVSGLVDSRSTQSTQLIVHVECVFPEQTPVVLRSEASVYRSRDGVYGVECVSGQLSAPAPGPGPGPSLNAPRSRGPLAGSDYYNSSVDSQSDL